MSQLLGPQSPELKGSWLRLLRNLIAVERPVTSQRTWPPVYQLEAPEVGWCGTVKRGVTSPLAAGRWIAHPTSSFNGCHQLETIGGAGTALWLLQAGARWLMGSLYRYTMCKRNKQSVARTAGACWAPLGALGRLQLAGAAPTPAESPPWAGVSTPPGGCRFRFVGAGRWNAQWGLEEKAPSPPSARQTAWVGSAQSMAMLTYRLTGSLPPQGGRDRYSARRGWGLGPSPPGKRQLPG